MLSQPEKSLRLKVWATVLMTVAIVTVAVMWSYMSFNELKGSINQLSEPSHKLTLINDILRDLISAENNVQSYIITGSVKTARTYERQVDTIRVKIGQLKGLLAEDSTQLGRVDDLEQIFQKKLDYLNRFLILKKKRQDMTFTKMALEQIEASTASTPPDSVSLSQGGKGDAQVDSTKLEGLWDSLRAIYAEQGIPYDTTRLLTSSMNDSISGNPMTMDGQIMRDSLLAKVRTILAQTGNMELRMQQNLSKREEALLNQGKVFMDEIQSIVSELEANERLIAANRKEEASAIATDSIRTIGLIGLGGLLIAVLLLALISRDIGKAAYFRRKLEVAKQRAEQFAQVKERFLANMSHEIRTPLNSILGFTQLMKSTRLSTDQEDFMKAVDSSSNYLMELVNDILDHSKIESGKLELLEAPFSTAMLAEEAKSMFLLSAQDKQLEFEVRVEHGVPPVLNGDAFRIKQIIHNLLSNAIKFTREGKVVLVIGGRWFKDDFYMEVRVSDTGIGIHEDKLDLIFESFRQEEVSMSDHFGGTGLGLTICKQLAEAMAGSIAASSKKGEGTTFTLKVPLSKALDLPVEAEAVNKTATTLQYQARVVMVEDDPWNALLLQTLLLRKVSDVKVFQKPEEALDFVSQHTDEIDLLFTDMKMPGMTGEQFATACHKAGYNEPIIVVSAYLPKQKEEGLLLLGVEAVMNKPYTEWQLAELLSKFLVHKNVESSVNSCMEPMTGSKYTIDLTDLRLFAGNDPTAFEELVAELIVNSRQQMNDFEVLVKEKDWKLLAELAHRMLPTYDHTGVMHVSELLRSIELYAELNNYERVADLSLETLAELKACVRSFEQFRTQVHTA